MRVRFMLLLCCMAAALPAVAQDSLPDPRTFWLDEAQEQLATVHISYRSLVARATTGDTVALSNLITLHGLDGAGAEVHAEVLWALLCRWGDQVFSALLRKTAREVRLRAVCNLDFAAPSEWFARFPKTYRSARHQASCRGW